MAPHATVASNEPSANGSASRLNGSSTNGHHDDVHGSTDEQSTSFPLAICGIGLRLPGGLETPEQLFDFLLAKGDARGRVPASRYNVSAYYSPNGEPGTVATEYGYFLDESVGLGNLDVSRFSLSRADLEATDPQHRIMLEVARECVDDAGEMDFRGRPIGCFVGNFGEEFLDIQNKDPLQAGTNKPEGQSEFMLSNRVSYEMDLRGPSMTIRTACSSALVALNEARLAMERGDCEGAIVGGASLILAPGNTATMSQYGVLSPEGSCKSFSADADGYARAEAVSAVYVKPLAAAVRDGNPIRAVIRATATNFDGKTAGVAHPSTDAQEALLRKAYRAAGISDFSKTAVVECHGTGTPVGDPIEAKAVARLFGEHGVYLGSVKPNLGHGEGASGLTSLIKAVLALEHKTILPNIKFTTPNPNIPFKAGKLTVPVEPTPWPQSKHERVSINAFGMGGTNAHVIVDSAASFDLATTAPSRLLGGNDTPQLLVLSANTAGSLKKMTERFRQWFAKARPNTKDLAYTMALRREHFLHRAFFVAQGSHLGELSQTRKAPAAVPALVMVFTGQGAQWAQMGRELLLRSDLPFQKTIRALDKHLQESESPPSWSIEKELLKPAKISKIQKAELSQPLCTAVQVALVDLLAEFGVTPAAVVGHSSGEIAAAYAAGSLTAKEAIITSWKRGIAAQKQTRPGAMAAIGLGWDEVTLLLEDGVVVACENSPKSVTISGDVAAVKETVARVRDAYPNTTARPLKVDKAYHSRHMKEIGGEYCAMIERDLEGVRAPTVPFFSSVLGKRTDEVLGAEYWQRNLESPVLFKSAVSNMLTHFSHAAFLEVGPHSALAGPLRQILAEASRPPLYASVMTRGVNCVESYLSALGSLYELNVPVDFAKLTAGGSCLANLPPYSWDHEVEYWRESRISRAWRQRKFPAHPLLGVDQMESTSLEPSWRNMLRVNQIPWVRDHRIEENIIFPAAGYVAMAGEAMRQITGSDVFSLRHLLISAAMVMNEDEPTEVVTTLRPHKLTDSLDSAWWEFSISSWNGHVWMKHCSGQVSALDQASQPEHEQEEPLPRCVKTRNLYNIMDESGLCFGPTFQRLEDVRTGTTEGLATAKVVDLDMADDKFYHVHPTVVDACLQAGPIAAFKGRVLAKHYRRVPTKIDSLTVRRVAQGSSSNRSIKVSASATHIKGSGEVIGLKQQVLVKDNETDASVVAVHIEGLYISPLEEAEMASTESLQNTARFVWRPHLDFMDGVSLIKPVIDWKLHFPRMQELAHLCMIYTWRDILDITPKLPHHVTFKDWLKEQFEGINVDTSAAAGYLHKDGEAIMEKINELVEAFSTTDVAAIAQGIRQVTNNMPAIISGEKDALEVLLSDDLLNKIYVPADASDRSRFIETLAHTKPNLRILEIGAGTGASTASMLSYLVLPGPLGQSMYAKYTYTDISSGFFPAAKERFKGHRNIEYKTLDISRDPHEQGFAEEKYDLVIATNVIHATTSLSESLANVRKLLDRDGRLLLHELHTHSKWPNFIFGIVPGWWLGAADGRPDQPYVTPERWDMELRGAGFAGLEDGVALDGESPYQLNAIMVARPAPEPVVEGQKIITLLSDGDASQKLPLATELEQRGYTVEHRQLGEGMTPGQDIIALLDCDRPFFKDIDEATFAAFQRFLAGLDTSKLFWVTHGCQVGCRDPEYAQVVGMARASRVEILANWATCEVVDLGSPSQSTLGVVADVFARFQSSKGDETLRPDYEFAVVDDVVHVPRAYPVLMREEMTRRGAGEDDQMILEATKPGRLTSLRWSPRERKAELENDEVEVEVYATGLNFKDVLGALNMVPYPDDGLGGEGAGLVRHVGPGVKDIKVGDHVMFIKTGAFTTNAIVGEGFCVKIPDNLAYEDAATMPAVFITTIEALLNVGNLTKGQSILIHCACGGVGLAAIQIAKMVGAEIYCTVGNDDKVNLLTETFGIPLNRIFNSRDTSFLEGVMRETHGEGVDLALNSLAGELLHATWRCVAEFGKMVEIGKRDLLEAGKLDMEVFLGARSYHGVYVDIMVKKPERCKRNLSILVDLFDQGHVGPIRPITTYDASSVQEAFRFMQQGLHVGKLVISLRHPDGIIKMDTDAAVTTKQLVLDSSASYLLVGGLGGLGRSIARHLVEHNARRLVFLSRSAGDGPEDRDFIRELESQGCNVQLVKGSVISSDDVNRAVSQAPNLRGIVQASMVLRDETFAQMSLGDWRTAVEPKVRGTWNLHRAALDAGADLDFFILLSSMSGTTGLAGQSNYAAANTFLDAFAQYRTSLGLPCTSIDLGAVRDAGYVANDEALLKRMRLTGSKGVTEVEVLEAITMGILSKPAPAKPAVDLGKQRFVDPNTLILGLLSEVPLGSTESRALWKNDRRMAVYHNSSSDASDASTTGSDVLKTFLANAKRDPAVLRTPEAVQLLAVEIGRKLFSFLLKSEDDLDVSVSLSSLGLDSLVGVEMRSWWRQTLGFDITVLEMLGMGTLEGLGRHAAQGMLKVFGDDAA